MSQWYQHNHRLFREERKRLAEACELMMLSVVGPGFPINSAVLTNTECAIAHGTYSIQTKDGRGEIEYGITLWTPPNYPKLPPVLFGNDPKLPIANIDRHIPGDGQACLAVNGEIEMHWPDGSNLVDFIEKLVAPFLAWQAYYDAYGCPPSWGGRSHGNKGIIEFYADILRVKGDKAIIGFMKLLARKKQPKGHEICPCGSGRKLRDCHQYLLKETRSILNPKKVRMDLAIIDGNLDPKIIRKKGTPPFRHK